MLDMAQPQRKPSRLIVRIDVSPKAKLGLAVAADRAGLSQVVAVDRLFKWLADQPEGVQLAALGQYPPELAPHVARLVLDRLPAKR